MVRHLGDEKETLILNQKIERPATVLKQ